MILKFDPYTFEEIKIDNIPVLYKHIDTAPCIHIRLVFNYGAFCDTEGKEGIAHFLEHMLFNGDAIYKDKKENDLFAKKYFINTLNASTGFFDLKVTGKCLPENFDKAIEGMFNMIINPKLRLEDFNEEKKVIIQESWKVFLNDKYINYIKKIINNNDTIPNRKRMYSALGWPDTIENITHQDILDAHKKYFIKENFKIFIAGNINDINLSSKLTPYIEQMPSGEKNPDYFVPEIISEDKVKIFENKRVDIGLTDKKQTMISMDIVYPRIKDKIKEKIFLKNIIVLKRVIGDILFERLRLDNSWCYGANTDFHLTRDRMYFVMDSEVNPDYKDETIKIMHEILTDIKTDKYKLRFEEIKQVMLESTISSERLTGDILDNVLYDYLNLDHIITLKEYIEELESITFEDIKKFANENIILDKFFTEIFLPNNINNKKGFIFKVKNYFGKFYKGE